MGHLRPDPRAAAETRVALPLGPRYGRQTALGSSCPRCYVESPRAMIVPAVLGTICFVIFAIASMHPNNQAALGMLLSLSGDSNSTAGPDIREPPARHSSVSVAAASSGEFRPTPIEPVSPSVSPTQTPSVSAIALPSVSPRARPSQWPKAKVIVPAVYKEWLAGVPAWASPPPEEFYATVLYQRLDPSAPLFAPNYGNEGAVYLRFIVEHYDSLPEFTLFTQGTDVGAHSFNWLKCVRSTTHFAQLPHVYVDGRDIDTWHGAERQVFVESCWRDLLETFGVVVAPRDRMRVTFECCAAFLVSRSQLLRHSRATYERALELVGTPRCHRGPLDVPRLHTAVNKSEEIIAQWQALAADPNRVDDENNRHAGAGAFEHLHHVFIGGEPFSYPREAGTLCAKFLPQSQCPGSPCTQ